MGDRLELTDIYLERHKSENRSYENQIHDAFTCKTSSKSSAVTLTFFKTKNEAMIFSLAFITIYKINMKFIHF